MNASPLGASDYDASVHSAATFLYSGNRPVTLVAAKKKSRKRGIWLIAAAIALLFVLVGVGVLYAFTSGFHNSVSVSLPTLPGSISKLGTSTPTASITITPAHTNFDQTYKIFAVTGVPNTSSHQVDARFLSSSATVQSSTIAATGKTNTVGVRATGQIIFDSFVSTAHTFYAGQIYGTANGLTAVLSETFTLAAFGGPSAYNAYISTAGTNGNIPAKSINTTCCGDGLGNYIDIYNSQFSGGVNPQSYTYLQQSDLNNAVAAANQIESAETTSARAAITG